MTWECEKECFTTFAKELSDLYAVRRNVYSEYVASHKHHDSDNNAGGDARSSSSSCSQSPAVTWQWTVEHVIYPAFRTLLMPPKSLSEDTSVLQLADLPDLYKVFERC